MGIVDIFKFLSPFHDMQDKYKDDLAKGVNPVIDSAFVFSLLRLLSVAGVVFFGVTIDEKTITTLSANIPLLISAAMAVYAEIMKISAAYFAAKKLSEISAHVAQNHEAIKAIDVCTAPAADPKA